MVSLVLLRLAYTQSSCYDTTMGVDVVNDVLGLSLPRATLHKHYYYNAMHNTTTSMLVVRPKVMEYTGSDTIVMDGCCRRQMRITRI